MGAPGTGRSGTAVPKMPSLQTLLRYSDRGTAMMDSAGRGVVDSGAMRGSGCQRGGGVLCDLKQLVSAWDCSHLHPHSRARAAHADSSECRKSPVVLAGLASAFGKAPFAAHRSHCLGNLAGPTRDAKLTRGGYTVLEYGVHPACLAPLGALGVSGASFSLPLLP